MEVKFCYAPISQKDREWRKLEDDLTKDKTCQRKIVANTSKASYIFSFRENMTNICCY
ncbi:hypothetical protein ACJIZ3_023858 [Penstemon smallii]|uniref:Uncharacterized protein n=1 Tax=Penstemon smallii TaxID=265156 RepID=A0ABD3TQ77_9LAMI